MAFPASLDGLTRIENGQRSDEDHLNQIMDAVEAAQAKVGVDDSAVETTLDYRVNAVEEAIEEIEVGGVVSDIFVNALDYATGDGTTDDFAALKTAAAAAITAGKPLYLGAAHYRVVIPDTTNNFCMDLTGDLLVFGAGRDRTKFTVTFAATPTKNLFLFRLSASAHVTMRDFKCVSTGPYAEVPSNHSAPRFIGHTGGSAYTLHFERVDIDGFGSGIATSSGQSTGTTEIRVVDCEWLCKWQCVGYFVSTTTNTHRFYGVRSRFETTDTITSDDGDADFHLHPLYIHPGVSVYLDGCTSKVNQVNDAYHIHHFGSSSVIPDSFMVRNHRFLGNGWAAKINNSVVGGAALEAFFDNCDIRCANGGLKPVGLTHVHLTDSYCSASQVVGHNDTVPTIACNTFIRGCTLENSSIQARSAGGITKVADCEIILTSDNDGIAQSAAVGDVQMSRVRFLATADFTGRAVKPRTGRWVLDDCVFDGVFDNPVMELAHTTVEDFDIRGCQFLYTGTGRFFVSPSADTSGAIHGSNNYFAGSVIPELTHYAQLTPRPGIDPTTVASAATIGLSWNYDTFRVSGSTTINTIRMGSDADSQRMMTGLVHLIVDASATWALGTSGNIKPKNTSAHVADDLVTLRHDPKAGFWYEVA